MGKSQIIRRIHNAANTYKDYFVGNTYMFVYGDQYVEVIFKKSSFLHLTGVNTKLNSENFYDHALRHRGLRPQEIFFDRDHPYDLADKKTNCLSDLYKITIQDILIATDLNTMTLTYAIGITNLEFVICLGNATDKAGNLINNYMVPYSFRVETIQNNKFNDLFEVTHILKKRTGNKKYNTLTFGDETSIKHLSKEIKEKIELKP